MANEQLEALVFPLRVARIDLEDQRDRLESAGHAGANRRAQLQQKREARWSERLGRTQQRSRVRTRTEGVQLPRGVELPLKTCAVEGVIDVGCTELAHHGNDPRAAEVSRVR